MAAVVGRCQTEAIVVVPICDGDNRTGSGSVAVRFMTQCISADQHLIEQGGSTSVQTDRTTEQLTACTVNGIDDGVGDGVADGCRAVVESVKRR